MYKQKQTGFTLIELLVVIVIIGILATISTATFTGYFAQARDGERQATVQNIVLLVKVQEATNEDPNKYAYTGFDQGANTVETILDSNDFRMPVVTAAQNTAGKCYIYGSNGTDFFTIIHNDDGTVFFVDGTTAGIDAVAGATPVTAITCNADGIAPTFTGGALTGYTSFKLAPGN